MDGFFSTGSVSMVHCRFGKEDDDDTDSYDG